MPTHFRTEKQKREDTRLFNMWRDQLRRRARERIALRLLKLVIGLISLSRIRYLSFFP